MKTLALIVGILFLLAASGLSYMTYDLDQKDIAHAKSALQQVEDFKKQMGADADAGAKLDGFIKEQMNGQMPSPGRISAGAWLALLLLLLCLADLVVAFVKPGILMPMLIGIAVLAVIAILVHPTISKGEYSGASGKTVAMMAAGCAIVGAAATYFAKGTQKQAA